MLVAELIDDQADALLNPFERLIVTPELALDLGKRNPPPVLKARGSP